MDQRSTTWRTAANLMAATAPDLPVPRTESRCKICTASEKDIPHGAAIVNLIDDLLCVPRTYASIMRLVAPLTAEWPEEARFSKYSLIRHARRHLRLEQAAFRGVADRRRRGIERVASGADRMLDAGVVLEAIQQRGIDLLLEGEIRPSVRDLLAATSALRDLEMEAGNSISQEDVLVQVENIVQAMREIVPPELLPAVIARIERGNPLPMPVTDQLWEEFIADPDD